MKHAPRKIVAPLAVVVALAAFAVPPLVRGQEEHHEGTEQHADAGETFEHGMEHANKAYQSLKKSVFDAMSRESDLRQSQTLEEALLASKSVADEMPMMGPARKKYGDDAAAYHRDLRAGLLESIQATLKLEAAVNAGDTEAAKAAFQAVAQTQKEGHRDFRAGRDNVGRPDAKGD